MGITSINYAIGASYGAYSQKLTQATKDKLEALGIQFNPNMTEDEGKKLLKTKASSKQEKMNHNNLFQNDSSNNGLFEKALKLAQKLGIQASEEMPFSQLLAIIEDKLKEKIQANQGNIQALKELKSLSQDLANLQAQSSGSMGFDSTNQALMQSLEMLGEYNKNFLNR